MLATGKRYIKIDFPTPLEKKREAWCVWRGALSPSLRLHWPPVTGHWPLFSRYFCSMAFCMCWMCELAKLMSISR